jgi:hypothetical protein
MPEAEPCRIRTSSVAGLESLRKVCDLGDLRSRRVRILQGSDKNLLDSARKTSS